MKIFYVFLLSVLVLSCEKDEVTPHQEVLSKNDMLGTWKVSYLEHADVTELSDYVFDFNPDNELVITKNEEVTLGTWEIRSNGKELKILIPEKEYPLRTLHSEWHVNNASVENIKLTETNSDNGFLEKSHFARL